MKSKILFILVAMALVLGVSLVGCTGPVTPTIPTRVYIGLARDLSGPLDVFECGYGGLVYRYFTNVTNTAGGIPLSGYNVTVPIELKVLDFDVLTWDLADVTATLLGTYHVDFIWGGPGTDCIFTQAPICNAAEKVLITLEGGASSMIWSHKIDIWPYVWVTLSFSNWNQIPVLHDMLVAATNNSHPTAYITYIGEEGATHGIEYRNETIAVFGSNYTLNQAGSHSYILGGPEAAAIITAAWTAYNSTPYDIFCAYTYPWNVATLQAVLFSTNFHPPAVLFGPGGNANYNPVYWGNKTDGLLSFIVADNHTSAALTNMYAGLAIQGQSEWGVVQDCAQGPFTSGWQMLDYWGEPCYWAGLELWKDAIEATGNLSAIAVRNHLATLNTTTVLGAHTWFTVFGPVVGGIGQGGGILAYQCHPGEIGQWINGEYRIVGGISPTANFTYNPTWNFP